MNGIESYKDALNAVKRGFLIIGLTGYTGAGCSTIRKLLTQKEKLELPPHIKLQESYHVDKIEYQKLRRIWEEYAWEPFNSVEFSGVIFCFALRRAMDGDYFYDGAVLEGIRKLGEPFSEELKGLNLLVDGDTFNERDSKELIRAFERASTLYEQFCKNYQTPQLVKVMQHAGDQIRKCGDVTPKRNVPAHPKYLQVLPRAVRNIMKAYRRSQSSEHSRFCIDAFRNPYEVEYFSRRYSEFYLVHVTRERKYRRESLGTFPNQDFEKLEKREKGEVVQEKTAQNIQDWFPSQNINECTQKADFFINNVQDQQQYLSYHLIRLLALTHQPGCVPPTEDERSMQMAMTARQMSGCISRQVGAVVVAPSGFVVGVGWNDPPKGQVPCSLRTGAELVNDPSADVFSDFELSDKFRNHMKKENCKDEAFCFKNEYTKMQKQAKNVEYTRALHAEENAFLQATDHSGGTLQGSALYSTTLPCMLCAKKSYHLGVKRIVYIDAYSDIAIDQVIQAGNKENRPTVVPFEGATGSAYFRLFTPIVPEKDWNTIYAEAGTERAGQNGT